MVGAIVQTKRPPESGDLSLQVSLVAGARNRQYRPRYTSSRHEPVPHVVCQAFNRRRPGATVRRPPAPTSEVRRVGL
jgi:hypothetical protein